MNTQYSIYQINPARDNDRLLYLGYELNARLFGHFTVKPEIYDKVYDGEVSRKYDLEDIFVMLNNSPEIPDDYRGHLLSVSDVIEIRESDSVPCGFWFVDGVGFKKINFDKTKCGGGDKNEKG